MHRYNCAYSGEDCEVGCQCEADDEGPTCHGFLQRPEYTEEGRDGATMPNDEPRRLSADDPRRLTAFIAAALRDHRTPAQRAEVLPLGTQTVIGLRFYCANNFATAIVVTVTAGIDWGCYIGGADPWSEDAAYRFVSKTGCKLSEDDARHLCPGMTLPYRT